MDTGQACKRWSHLASLRAPSHSWWSWGQGEKECQRFQDVQTCQALEHHLFDTTSFSSESSVSQSRQEASGPRGVPGSVPSTGHLPSSPQVQRPGPRLSTHLMAVPSLGAPRNFWAPSLPSRRLYGAGSRALRRLVPPGQLSPPTFATYWHGRTK